jgi:hypothetical protein
MWGENPPVLLYSVEFWELYNKDIQLFPTLIKKEKKSFLIFKEIQKGAVAKSNMKKGFVIYEEMRKYLVIYEEAVSHIWPWTDPFWISSDMTQILFSFLSVEHLNILLFLFLVCLNVNVKAVKVCLGSSESLNFRGDVVVSSSKPFQRFLGLLNNTEAGVLVRKLRQPTPLSWAKRANPRCFILLFGISYELAGCVHRPSVDSYF